MAAPHPRDANNSKSAKSNIVGQKINAENEAGRVAGSFEERPLSNQRVPLWVRFLKKKSGHSV